MAIDKEKNTQILVTFPIETVKRIENYWHKKKIKNRNEAIRELIAKGLDNDVKESPDD